MPEEFTNNQSNESVALIDSEEFFSRSLQDFKTLPVQSLARTDLTNRRALFGILGGLFGYLSIHALPNADKLHNQDEIAALLAALAGIFIGGVHRNFRHLCSPTQESRDNRRSNIFNGTMAGIAIGFAAAAILPVIGIPTVPIIAAAGIVAGGSGAGAGAGYLFNKILKKKYCPHCDAKGHCSQIVCRSCHRIFFPNKEPLDCSRKPFLDWFDAASFLDGRRLTYLDAEVLVKKHMKDWKVKLVSGVPLVECHSFMEWVREHEAEILQFKDSGVQERRSEKIEDHLHSLDEKAMTYRNSSNRAK